MKKKVKKKRTQSQIGKHSRRKGKTFECWCARYFTKWTGLDWQTTRNSGRTDLKGDIYCVEYPDSPLVIECKNRKEYSVHAMLKPTKGFVDMIEVCRDKIDVGQGIVFIVKNETGVWMSNIFKKHGERTRVFCLQQNKGAVPLMKGICNTEWLKIQDVYMNNGYIGDINFGENPETK